MIKTEKYIRKPLHVDAVRVTDDNIDEMATWCQGEIQQGDADSTKKFIKVRVHNPKNLRQTQAFAGDWILYTERGYKVYTNKAFHASFDPLQGVDADAAAQQTKPPHVDARPAADAEGKRVITPREQREMNPTELRELLQSGEAVLEQDVAA